MPELPAAQEAVEPADRARLRRTAEYLARIQHPNVVQIERVEEDDEQTVLHFQKFSCSRFDEVAESKSPAELCRAFANVCATLNELHRKGIVHGELKPSDLLYVSSGRIVIAGLVDPQDRLFVTTTEDDVSAVLEMARSYIPKLDKPLRKLLMQQQLPTASQLVDWFSARANTQAPRPKLRRFSTPQVSFALAVAVVVAVGLLSVSNEAKEKRAVTTKNVRRSITTLKIEGSFFSAGETNAVLVSGDFRCDGSTVALMLRPSEGTLWQIDISNELTSTGKLIQDGVNARTIRTIDNGTCDAAELVATNNQTRQVDI